MNVQEIRGRLNMMTDEQKDKLLKMLDPGWQKGAKGIARANTWMEGGVRSGRRK